VVGAEECDADGANVTICSFEFSAAPFNGMDIPEYGRDMTGNSRDMPREGRDMLGKKGRDNTRIWQGHARIHQRHEGCILQIAQRNAGIP
jgi:hypothetical protein